MAAVDSLAPGTMARLQRHGEALATVCCGLLAIGGWAALADNQELLGSALFLASYVVGGYRSARDGLLTLFRRRELDVDLLMVASAIGAAMIGYWSDGAILIFIFSLSGTLESYASRRSQRELSALLRVRPERAWLLRNGQEVEIAASALQVGDMVLIKPGERIPADGQVVVGASAVNQAPITGESLPVDKAAGAEVFAGTLNGEGMLQVAVSRAPEESLIAGIVRLVERATSERPPAQLFIERFEKGYARVVVAGALAAIFLPPLVLGWTWDRAIYRAMILLVVASPCALVVSMMPTLLSGIAAAARKGILIKGGGFLESIGRVRVLAVDKTGTLTTGVPRLTDVVALDGDSDRLLAVVAAAESLSEHPIARAVVAGAQERGLSWRNAEDLQATPGRGVWALVAGQAWWIGNAALMTERGFTIPKELACRMQEMAATGKSTLLAADTAVRGLLAVRDTVRPEAIAAFAELRRLGIERVVMVTGDNRETARAIAAELGCEEVHAALLPQQKVDVVRDLVRRYGQVAMVGDGVNDAPALAAATVGIAMGVHGTPVALEVADIVLMRDELHRIGYAVRLGRRANGLIRQNLTVAIGVITALVASNFLGYLTLPLGVVGHEGSTVLVTLNGLRLLRGPGRSQPLWRRRRQDAAGGRHGNNRHPVNSNVIIVSNSARLGGPEDVTTPEPALDNNRDQHVTNV